MTLSTTSTPAPPASYLPVSEATAKSSGASSDLSDELTALLSYISASGFVYEPWQVAAYVTAIRTKPFVVLAGVSGLGKSKLPRLVSDATGGRLSVKAVKPDWTDSSEVVGHEDLTGVFHPGALAEAARDAEADPDHEHFFVLDEINLARVEYYLAEALSVMEERVRGADGRIVTPPLQTAAPQDKDGRDWSQVGLPGNLAVVGSLNMDETTHGFSRKVLDRAFVLEFDAAALDSFGSVGDATVEPWASSAWKCPFIRVGDYPKLTDEVVVNIVQTLVELNEYLARCQLNVGYRVRDQVILFCVNAGDVADHFTTLGGESVDPLDLALMMKVLPRVQGGGPAIGELLEDLAVWSAGGSDGAAKQFPFCAERVAVMKKRFLEEGFTSFWL
jgi:hypothetical protein